MSRNLKAIGSFQTIVPFCFYLYMPWIRKIKRTMIIFMNTLAAFHSLRFSVWYALEFYPHHCYWLIVLCYLQDPNHDIGKILLKPHDPRRILFNDNMLKSPNSLHQLTSNIIDTKVHASSTSKLCGDAVEQDKEREVEEQNKLFASHKLCLVLDLDLTLLNSVKVWYFFIVFPFRDYYVLLLKDTKL